MKIRQQNAFAVLTILVLLAILFISFFVMVKPFAMVYDKLNPDARFAVYTNQTNCETYNGYWINSECKALPERAGLMVQRVRYFWLIAPIILAIGLIIWLFIVATRRDPQHFQLGP